MEAVQLIGRWGSDAIRRYIQEAPLQLQHIANPRAPQSGEINTQQLRSMVQKEVQALQHQFWVVNEGLPCPGSPRDMHRQQPVGHLMRLELWNIPLSQAASQADHQLLHQVLFPGLAPGVGQ